MKPAVYASQASPQGGWRGKVDISLSAAKQVRRVLLTVLGIALITALGYLLWAWHFRPMTHLVCLPVTDYHKLAVPPVPVSEGDIQRLEEGLSLARPATVWRNFGTLADMSKMPNRLQSVGSRPKDTLIFYLSAHGVSGGETAYVLCSDYLLDTGNERYPLSELLDQLRAVPAALKLLILDVGHIRCDPRLGMVVNEFPQILEEQLASGDPGSNLWVLSANRPLQASYTSAQSRRSVFSQCVTEGLLGAADDPHGNRDGKIDLGELYAYVCDGVRDCVKEELGDPTAQTPWLLRDGEGEVSRLPGEFLLLAPEQEPQPEPEEEQQAEAAEGPPKEEEQQKPEPQEPAPQPPPKALEELRQLADRVRGAMQSRDPSGPGPSWGPTDYAPHRWREFLELLSAYELRHRYGVPILEANLARTLAGAERDFGRSDDGLKADRDVGFDAAAQGTQRVGQIRALIQLKNELLFWAPYYVSWYVRTSQTSASHQANVYQMVSALLAELRQLLDEFDAFEQAGLDDEPSRSMQARLEQLQQKADDLRDLDRQLRETLDDQVASLVRNPLQRGNPGRIEALLGIPLLSGNQRARLLEALVKADWPQPLGARGPLDLEQLGADAAQYAAQQEALLPRVAKLQEALALLSVPDSPIELPEETAARRPEAYRQLAAQLQEFYRRLPERVNAVGAASAASGADIRRADRCLRLVDSSDAEGLKPISWPLLREVPWTEVLISGPTETLSLNWRQPTALEVTIRTSGRSLQSAVVTLDYDPDKVRIETADRPQVVQPGEPATLRLAQGQAILRYQAAALADNTEGLTSDVELTVRAGAEQRSCRVSLRLPAPDQVRLLAYRVGATGEVPMEQLAGDRIRLRPFPNRETPLRFELENLSDEAKQLEVHLLGLKGLQHGQAPSWRLLFDDSGGMRAEVEVLAATVSMTLQPQGPPEPIAFTLPEPPPGEAAGAEPAEDQPPQPKPLTWACAIFDKTGADPAVPKWVYWIDFLPLIPREYLVIRGGRPQYDAQQGRLTILIEPRAVDARGRPILPADLKENPILVTWESRGEMELSSARTQAKIASADAVAELFADVQPQPGRVIDVDLHVDGYPRGFMFRVECTRNGQILDMQDQIDIRITAPTAGQALRIPLTEPIPVAFQIDTPADAFLDTQDPSAQNMVRVQFASVEDAGGFSPVEIGRYFSDRRMEVFLPKIDPPGVLKIRAQLGDFQIPTSNHGLENARVRIQARLELPGLKSPQDVGRREDSVEIVLDGRPPVIQTDPLDDVLPGEPAELSFDAEDLSGIRDLEARFSEARTQQLQDGKTLILSPQQGADRKWHVSLPTDDLKKPGTYWLLWRVSDHAGNLTETMVEELTVRAPQADAGPPPTTATIQGRVLSPDGEPRAGAQVTLDPLGTQAAADAEGKFTFRDVPPGTYTLRVQQRIKGQAASTSKQVDVKAGQKLTIDKIELSMWSRDEE